MNKNLMQHIDFMSFVNFATQSKMWTVPEDEEISSQPLSAEGMHYAHIHVLYSYFCAYDD